MSYAQVLDPTLEELRNATVVHTLSSLPSGYSLLDIGCGPGQYRGVHKGSYIGIDRTHEDYKPGVPRTPDVVGDAESLPFPNDSFDAILYVGVLYHFRSLFPALEEAGRVLRPNGRLLVFDYGPPTVRRLDRHYIATGQDARGFVRTVGEWRESLDTGTWREVSVARWSMRPMWRWLSCFLPGPGFDAILNRLPGGLMITAKKQIP